MRPPVGGSTPAIGGRFFMPVKTEGNAQSEEKIYKKEQGAPEAKKHAAERMSFPFPAKKENRRGAL